MRAYLEAHPAFYGSAAALLDEAGTVVASPYVYRTADGLQTRDLAQPDYALAALDVAPERVTMVGDSWENDILGALGSGMAAVWLNRYRLTCPDPGLAVEIRGLEPVGDVLEILGVQTSRD